MQPKHLRNITRILATALLALFALQSVHAGFLQWQDNFVGYRYGQAFREPYNPENISKNIFQFQHADGYAWGSNFFNIDMLRSCGSADPKALSNTGATEYYAVYRNTLSAEKLFGLNSKKWSGGIIRDIGLTIGGDANTKNDLYGSQVRELFVGPTVSFEVPGFLTLGLLLDKENNRAFGKHIYYNPTYCVSAAWGIPILQTPFTFKGFANFIGAKGKGTEPETYIEAAIMVDPFFNKPAHKGKYFVGLGYQFWDNKFGVDNDGPFVAGGARATCFQLQLECHF